MIQNEKLALAIDSHQQGNIRQAIKLYMAVLREAPNNEYANSLLSQIVQSHFQLGHTLSQMGFHEQARACLQTALSIVPNNPEVHSQLGKIFINLKDAPRAVHHLRKYLRLSPDDKAGAGLLLAHLV